MDIRHFFKVIPASTEASAEASTEASTSASASASAEATIANHKVFVDGSAFNNGRKNCYGGLGVFFADNDGRNVSIKITDAKVSNNVGEIKACIEAINIITKTDKAPTLITIYSDSEYTIKSITKWAKLWEFNGWKRRGNKEIQNKALIIELYKLYNKYKIKFIHVRSHQKEPQLKTTEDHFRWYGNMMADKLARQAIVP
jgi:ribonuclease HI